MNLKTIGIAACLAFAILGRYPATTSGDPLKNGQTAAGEPPSVIRVSSNLVTVPVAVTDAEGRAIENLGIKDFLIEEDGRPEEISGITEAGRSSLQLALLFDISGSVNSRFEFEQKAAIRFLEKILMPGDRVSIVTFSDSPRIRLRASSSLSDAVQALSALEPTEKPTAFFDAVVLAAKTLYQSAGPETRQAIITLSDGEDNKSRHTLSETMSAVQRADTIFYSINPGGPSIRLNEISLEAQSDLAALARETGGSAFVSDRMADLDGVFAKITAELRTHYLLSYYSRNQHTDGAYRRISVSLPNRNDLRIRTRRGYYASSH
jgi:Ca-activated chloride channel family protein